MTRILRDPCHHQVVAELEPQQKVTIVDKAMHRNISMTGITLTTEFKKAHNVNIPRVYPSDTDAKIFAEAFEEVYFVHGLQQQGYYWEEKNPSRELTDKELAEKVMEQYFKNNVSTPVEENL
jgi:hypothetical protein